MKRKKLNMIIKAATVLLLIAIFTMFGKEAYVEASQNVEGELNSVIAKYEGNNISFRRRWNKCTFRSLGYRFIKKRSKDNNSKN